MESASEAALIYYLFTKVFENNKASKRITQQIKQNFFSFRFFNFSCPPLSLTSKFFSMEECISFAISEIEIFHLSNLLAPQTFVPFC